MAESRATTGQKKSSANKPCRDNSAVSVQLQDVTVKAVVCLGYFLIGFSLIIGIVILILVLTGHSYWANNMLVWMSGLSAESADGNQLTSGGWFWPTMQRMYPQLMVVFYILSVLFLLALLYLLLSSLARLGRWLCKLASNCLGRSLLDVNLLVALSVGTLVIVLLWVMLDNDIAFNYLLMACIGLGVMLLVVAFGNWLTRRIQYKRGRR